MKDFKNGKTVQNDLPLQISHCEIKSPKTHWKNPARRMWSGLRTAPKALVKSIQERAVTVGGHRVDKNGGQTARLNFIISATHDSLPCLANLARWFGSEGSCSLCGMPQVKLRHILRGCKATMAQGCYRHDQVLRKLEEVTENMRVSTKKKPPCHQKQLV